VEQVDLDELDDEEALCVALRNMSIGDVCPKESEEPPQAQDQPSSSTQASPPTQDEDQAQDDVDEYDQDKKRSRNKGSKTAAPKSPPRNSTRSPCQLHPW
jgi:hypothetical protein